MARISFQFGLEKEADIYCRASKVGLSTFSKQEMFDAIAHWTRNTVEELNDDSEDNVAWWIALYCSSVIKATMPDCSFDYDEIFKYAFIDYYSQFNY